MERAQLNSIELEYEVKGTGEPVLLISPVLADGFVPVVAEPSLADAHRLITYHRRGWRGSTSTAPPVTVADHAADAAALLAHLGIPRAHVAGHSSGAAVAVQLAHDRPELVHSLALLELSLLSVPSGQAFLQQAGPALAAYAAGDHEGAVALFLSTVSGLDPASCRAVIEEHAPDAVAHAVKDADTFFGVELPALVEWEFGRAQAATIDHPVLSVLGAQTHPLWVEVAEFLRSSVPHVEECTIEAVGHLLHLQRPKPVAEAMSGFLSRHRMTGV